MGAPKSLRKRKPTTPATSEGAGGQSPLRRELRATQVFRREGGSWKLLHRHADPLMEKRAPSAPPQK